MGLGNSQDECDEDSFKCPYCKKVVGEMGHTHINCPERKTWCSKCEQYYAGSGFTEYNCSTCWKKCVHPNTRVPKHCETCAVTLGVCMYCGGPL